MPAPEAPAAAAWVAAARRSTWIPPEFAAYELSLDDAATRLRAPRELVRRLVDAGLPAEDGHVDANDVFNLALELRWPATLPVTAFRGALRWLLRPVPELVAAQRWRCELTAPPGGIVHAARPAPQGYGGRWEPDADGPPAASDPRFPLARTVGGVATLPGRRGALPGIEPRRLLHEVLDSGHRWAKLPLALQSRPDVVAGLGYATCVSVSLQLAAALRAAGYPARSRRGYLIAPVATGHSWVELATEDGGWTVLDPVLVLLYRRLAELEPAARGRPEPELADGLLVNRVLATALPADEPLAVTGDGDAVEIATAFRKLDAAQPTQDREVTPA